MVAAARMEGQEDKGAGYCDKGCSPKTTARRTPANSRQGRGNNIKKEQAEDPVWSTRIVDNNKTFANGKRAVLI